MSERPNILIFMNDQEQAAVTEPGHPCRTPHADRLAAEGLQFTRCYTPTAHCCPSRATFQTGLWPSGHGVYNNVLNDAAINTDLRDGVVTFGERLSTAGYRLNFSGKWHVARHLDPVDCGWRDLGATSLGPKSNRRWSVWAERAAAGENLPRPRGRGELARPGWGNYQLYGSSGRVAGRSQATPGDERIVTQGLDGLREAARGCEPWCCFIGPNGPHDPYIIPDHYATMYDPAEVTMPASWHDDLCDRPVVYQRQHQFWSQLTDDEQREAVAHYWGYCTMQDDLLGRVLETLDETGQADRTLVIRMSDHGDYMAAHGLFMKGIPAFDEGYRVPCLMRWPEGIAGPGRAVDELVSLADFAPTFLELAGCQEPPPMHGRSLVGFLRNQPPPDWRQELIGQMNGVELYYSQRTVLTKDWKYVFNGFDWDELYHLATDPAEMVNLAPRPDRPQPESRAVIEDLSARLWRFSEATGDINNNPYPTTSLYPFGPMTGL